MVIFCRYSNRKGRKFKTLRQLPTFKSKKKADCWPFLRIEELFYVLIGFTVFTTLDVFFSYLQFMMYESVKDYKMSVRGTNTYQFDVMPFGLVNAMSTFQQMTDAMFKNTCFAQANLDHIVVHSNAINKHITHLQKLFAVINRHRLKLKISKYAFLKNVAELVGSIVCSYIVVVDQKKVIAIRDARALLNQTSLESLWGLCGLLQKTDRNFRIIIFAVLYPFPLMAANSYWNDHTQKALES